MKKSIVVNLFGGPCSGKSTVASGLFYIMKKQGYDVELITEYAKDMTWEERHKALGNQIFITGNQHHRLFRLDGEVEYIITDSSLLLGIIYDNKNRTSLKTLIMDEFDQFNNYNIFVNRPPNFSENGRNEKYNECLKLDEKIIRLLEDNNYEYDTIDYNSNLEPLINKIVTSYISINTLSMMDKAIEKIKK